MKSVHEQPKPRFDVVDNGDRTLTLYDSGKMLVDVTIEDAEGLMDALEDELYGHYKD